MAKANKKSGSKAVPSRVASVVAPGSSAAVNSVAPGSSAAGNSVVTGNSAGENTGDVIDLHPRDDEWREEMRENLREELRAEVRNAVTAAMREIHTSAPTPAPPSFPAPGAAFEVDEADIVEDEDLAEAMKRIEASNRSNKYAIRLAGIGKEGNRQQFLDMVELLDHLEKAEAALKSPELNWADITIGRDEIGATVKLVENRMAMIERIDAHPLSWPVATEYQRLKRVKTGDHEDEKLFQQAEKKVSDERKKREESVNAQRSGSARGVDRFHYKRPGTVGPLPFFCFVRFMAVYL